MKQTKTPTGKYGIKAYGTWDCFNSLRDYRAYLMDWIRETEGAEQERAVTALCNLEGGIYLTDTDAA